ncbi:hypothetical protein A7A78_09290 [Aequorivita soesokkakensis]|uniref:Uncharacterized protein n=1 Tax=Aequorivita soesokkakensis TaxID=1385699 RepID=A0A1A9LH77_9FLAO|nr:MarR family transcriptional regulator [Aequorivita soesokkakensis]OAD92111.1 hypothetical protein A7A78_09290 [Aequorivita soesokkakensis]
MKKEKFLEAVNSLKLYRRAELMDQKGRKLIKELYADPLPNDHVLKTLLNDNTTFLIGRKGTGKSTIFQRAQYELDQKKNITWAYIDIKSLYESSTSEVIGISHTDVTGTLNSHTIQKLHVFRAFMAELVKEIKKQIEKRIESNIWATMKDRFTGSSSELFEKLDQFIAEINSEQYINVTGGFVKNASMEQTDGKISKEELKVTATASKTPSFTGSYFISELKNQESKHNENFSKIFIRLFKIRELIQQLKEILATLNLDRIHIFIDDFSELPKTEMIEVVDAILTPFNNWSDEFIKLKVAVYPGRLYLGDIDKTKIDEVYLDIHRAYGRGDISTMEAQAVEFTKRLLEKRLNYYTKDNLEEYFSSSKSVEEIWLNLFYSSMGNPRILGYILYYCYETSVIYGNKINVQSIKDASKRYFSEKIGAYFKLNKFLHESFEERSSIYSLKELYEQIVIRSKELRSYQGSKLMKDIAGRPPTSHFHVISEYESVLSSLELNFFITKYYEMKDRDGKEVSIYALNYGLCQQESINFGRPQGKREYRLYYVERIFDYSPIVTSYLSMNQEIICDSCGVKQEASALPSLQKYDMLCPVCKNGKCKVINLSIKYGDLINEVSKESLLPRTELGILKTLHDERSNMFANQIAAELDCSYQLIGKRGRNLSDRELVTRSENETGRRIFTITEEAQEIYFNDEEAEDTFNFES